MADNEEGAAPGGAAPPVASPPAPQTPTPDSEVQARTSFVGTLEENKALTALATLRNIDNATILREMNLKQVVAHYHKVRKVFQG